MIIIVIFLILHSPAFALIYAGIKNKKTNKRNSLIYFIIAGIYFLVGIGICGQLLNGL